MRTIACFLLLTSSLSFFGFGIKSEPISLLACALAIAVSICSLKMVITWPEWFKLLDRGCEEIEEGGLTFCRAGSKLPF